MKQQRLILFIGIISFIFLQGAPVGAQQENQSVAQATLTAYELDAAPADQPLSEFPRWKSSLGEIQQAAATLLETNSKLNTESRQLNNELDALQVKIDQQRVKNAQVADDIVQLRGKAEENNDPAQIARLKEILVDRNQQVQAQRVELLALKAGRGSMDSRVALARLDVAGLEIDQKSKDVDVKLRDEAAINGLRAQSDGMRAKIVKAQQQEKLLREKTAELEKIENPHTAQAREVVAKIALLRERLAALQSQKNALQNKFEQVAADKFKAEQGPHVLRVQKLLGDRSLLEARLKENSEKLDALKNNTIAATTATTGLSVADMDRIQKQNDVMQEIIGNLRENVALLEYKVTTLQRYKDRNKAVPKK